MAMLGVAEVPPLLLEPGKEAFQMRRKASEVVRTKLIDNDPDH
jgi:hypothetical protein